MQRGEEEEEEGIRWVRLPVPLQHLAQPRSKMLWAGGGAGRGAGSRGRGRSTDSERSSTVLAPVSRATATSGIFPGDAFSKFWNPKLRHLVSVPHTFRNVDGWCTSIEYNMVFDFLSKFQGFNYAQQFLVQTFHDECVFFCCSWQNSGIFTFQGHEGRHLKAKWYVILCYYNQESIM